MPRLTRRNLLKTAGLVGLAPWVWMPKLAHAAGPGHGTVRHLLYIRLSGGFRFTAAFNGDVADEFNPFGRSGRAQQGTNWGPSTLLERAPFLDQNVGKERRQLGLLPVTDFTAEMAVLPCVDHEPFSARADGNHGTGLERFLTGYVGGENSVLTYLNYSLRAANRGLPAFSLGEAGMGLGSGVLAAYRPPVLSGTDVSGYGFDAETQTPGWARQFARRQDERFRDRLRPKLRQTVEAFLQARGGTQTLGEIFRSPLLNVARGSNEEVDGISNRDLRTMLGTDGAAQRVAMALRLFHFDCPAVFLNQGGYDHHSAEDKELPTGMEQLNWILSGTRAALKRMVHPLGGSYWDHTVVVLGSEFGRTTGGARFNSAGGSDHSSDFATRWMSMPFMGGVVQATGKGGQSLGATRRDNLKADGPIHSYRSVMKTLMDWLGGDTQDIFPADGLVEEWYV